jgi:outer membrane protein assembly factor BamA
MLAGSALAQDNSIPWKDSFYPYLTSGSNDFPLFVFHFEERKAADYEARTTYAGLLTAEVGASTRGSRFATLSFLAPLLKKDWRLASELTAQRDARFGFYGLGNNTANDKSQVTPAQPFLYRVHRTRYLARTEVTRHLKGPFSVALAAGFEHSHFSDLPGPSIFRATFGHDVRDDDATGRLTFIADTRDNEYNTHNGVLVEASALAGSGGNGYSRLTLIARGYLEVREGTVLAARIAGSGMNGSPPLNARFEIPAWETMIPVYGGAPSNRGLAYERLAGEDVLFANAEVRHDLLNLGDLGAVTLLGFFDAGRVFEGEPFKITTSGMKVGAGGGVGLRILRSTIFTFNFAGGSDGFRFSMQSGWQF